MAHMIYVLNIESWGISDEDFINTVEQSLYDDDLKYEGIDCFFDAKMSDYNMSDFGELEQHFDENLALSLTQEQLQEILLNRYYKAEKLLHACLDGTRVGLQELINRKYTIIDLLEESGDTRFVVPTVPERLMGLGDLLDTLFIQCVNTRKEVKARLVKGYKYYN